MNEENYQKVLDFIPHWKPTKYVRVFGISAIKSVEKMTFLEANEIYKRLKEEGKLPEGEW